MQKPNTECVMIRTSKNYIKKSFKNYKKSSKIKGRISDLKEWIIMENRYQPKSKE